MIVLDRIRLTGPVLTMCPSLSREDEGHSILCGTFRTLRRQRGLCGGRLGRLLYLLAAMTLAPAPNAGRVGRFFAAATGTDGGKAVGLGADSAATCTGS